MSKSLNYEDDVSEIDCPRFKACEDLSLEGQPCVIWGEDALAHHGIPIVVFDVLLLVHDIEKATQALPNHEFERTAANPRFKHTPLRSTEASRLALPVTGDHSIGQDDSEVDADRENGVILLSAPKNGITKFRKVATKSMTSSPRLYQDQGAEDYAMTGFVAVHIGYFYLYANEAWEPGSKRNLLEENRQQHLDYLAGKRNVVEAASDSPVLAMVIVRRDLPSSVLQQYYQNVRNMTRTGTHVAVIASGGINRPPPPVKPGQGKD